VRGTSGISTAGTNKKNMADSESPKCAGHVRVEDPV
jgi:hypothetical protein